MDAVQDPPGSESSSNFNPQSGDINSRTALSWAASKDHNTAIELLAADRRLVANSRDDAGLTALIWAILKSQDSAITTLIKQGYPIDESNKDALVFYASLCITNQISELATIILRLEPEDFSFGLERLFEVA
ncbi:hypothetical protein GGS24DRAFT_507942 [Hypoxylon argillaceum]|nr:hypothetical protein GGS24DRAFT_507942 [Hypoxylon argillaceum]